MTKFRRGNTTGNRFPRGQSGNPSGRPASIATYIAKVYPEFEGMALTKSEAAKTLICISTLTMPEVEDLDKIESSIVTGYAPKDVQ